MSEIYVGHGVDVTLNFELRLTSGEVIDSTFEGQPGTFSFGDGTLPAGFERLIQGMKAGERKTFDVTPENGFGMHNPQNLQTFQRSQFTDVESLEEGMVLSFADAAQAELPGVIKSIEGDQVTVDFNHPLAGKDLIFEAEIIALQPSQEAQDGN